MAKKRSSKTRVSKKSKPLPTPQVLQRAAKAVITGKCPLSRPNLVKMKRHRVILRKLANMKGKLTSKKCVHNPPQETSWRIFTAASLDCWGYGISCSDYGSKL